MDVEDEVSRCTMEATDEIKVGGTETMPTAIPDPSETGGGEAMKTGKGNPSRNAGTMARKATWRASVGKSALIRREPGPDPVPDILTKEIGSVRTTPKDPEEPDETRSKLNEVDHPEIGRGVVRRLRRVKPYDEP